MEEEEELEEEKLQQKYWNIAYSCKECQYQTHEQRITQYRRNRLSESQKKVYKTLNGETRDEDVIRDAKESKEVWNDIWGVSKKPNRGAEWLKEI